MTWMLRSFLRVLRSFFALSLVVFAALFLFWAMAAYNVRYLRYTTCIVLPNKARIGFNSFVDPDSYFFRPSVLLKNSDGTTLLDGDIWPIYVSETTVYGVVAENLSSDGTRTFAFRPDVGLVFESDDENLYSILVSEAGPDLPEASHAINTGLYGAYFNFLQTPKYIKHMCQLSLFP